MVSQVTPRGGDSEGGESESGESEGSGEDGADMMDSSLVALPFIRDTALPAHRVTVTRGGLVCVTCQSCSVPTSVHPPVNHTVRLRVCTIKEGDA